MNESVLIEVWKKSRDTAEHFDKTLGDFRKIVFAIDAGFIPVVTQIRLDSQKERYIIALGITLNLINLFFWVLEKHYHLYLVTAAKVAKHAEGVLGLAENIQLTRRIADAKASKQISVKFFGCSAHFYDFIYFAPIGLSVLLLWFIHGVWYQLMFWLFLVLELVLIVYVLRKHQGAGE